MTDPTPDYLALAERLENVQGRIGWYDRRGVWTTGEATGLLRSAASALRIADKTIKELQELVNETEERSQNNAIALVAAEAERDRLREALGLLVTHLAAEHACTGKRRGPHAVVEAARSLLSEKGEAEDAGAAPEQTDEQQEIELQRFLGHAPQYGDPAAQQEGE